MASSISSTTSKSGIENLDSYYQNLVNYTLMQEKVPLTRYTEQKDNITIKKAAYTDLKNKFDALQTAINKLRSNQYIICLETRAFRFCISINQQHHGGIRYGGFYRFCRNV